MNLSCFEFKLRTYERGVEDETRAGSSIVDLASQTESLSTLVSRKKIDYIQHEVSFKSIFPLTALGIFIDVINS